MGEVISENKDLDATNSTTGTTCVCVCVCDCVCVCVFVCCPFTHFVLKPYASRVAVVWKFSSTRTHTHTHTHVFRRYVCVCICVGVYVCVCVCVKFRCGLNRDVSILHIGQVCFALLHHSDQSTRYRSPARYITITA